MDLSTTKVECMFSPIKITVLNFSLVVIDRLSKFTHFMFVPHPFAAITIVEVFFSQVHKIYGTSTLIVSYHGSTFLSTLWNHPFKLTGSLLLYNLAYHTQIDGQTE